MSALGTTSILAVLLVFGFVSGGLIDLGQDALDAAKYPLITGFYRIEMHVDRLDTQGKSHTGLSCDPIGGCDPKIKAFIDTETPNRDFGGDSVPYDNYIVLYEGNDSEKVVPIGKTISRDICGKGVRKVAMRVRAMDKDTVNDDKIDNYKCFITGENAPAASADTAEWSAEIACPGEDRPTSKVFLKYRWYAIPESTCRPSSNGKGLFSGLLSR
ncbi:hypothetical protein RvY_03214 [Ramazzottius varieornatus]|uniref:Uncharacterized protein n=1 Tax=Ramazzottius varieornatus TaxID=947166 RepID=A0A1D1UMC1_RAMVA|nr:hypothetical protein RvY_03214 [Ramazzottius varieornatus]